MYEYKVFDNDRFQMYRVGGNPYLWYSKASGICFDVRDRSNSFNRPFSSPSYIECTIGLPGVTQNSFTGLIPIPNYIDQVKSVRRNKILSNLIGNG
jgi:hypothetical protein